MQQGNHEAGRLGAATPSHDDRRRGAVLILVLAVIAVLAMLVSAFSTLTRLERRASQNSLDGERARFIAWSGLERAKFELRRAVLTKNYPAQWIRYQPDYDKDSLYPALEQSTHPSFRAHLDPVPDILKPDPKDPKAAPKIPYPSGFLGSTYYSDPTNPGFIGDYYTLRVVDSNASIYLNDANPHLRKMLDVLARAVQIDDPNAEVGRRVLKARSLLPGGFRQVGELRGVLSEDEFQKISPYVTCHAWVDRKVVECGEQPTTPDVGQTSSFSFRRANLTLQPRAPININSAPKPVLVACFATVGYGGLPGKPSPSTSISEEKAGELADAVIEYRAKNANNATVLKGTGANSIVSRQGFQRWGEFYKFLQNEGGLENNMAAAVLANANPNTDINKLVPDLAMYRMVDKNDLTTGTTEFCFGPGGIYTIESLGTVLGKDGEIAASAKVRTTVRLFERYVETTQADFETDRIDPDSPSSKFKNLRDMTTLPEARNAGDSDKGLLKAEWDGQITYNVITLEGVSDRGAFSGFLERDLNGTNLYLGGKLQEQGAVRGQLTTTGNPAGGIPNSVLGGDVKSPMFMTGSDLQPLGARLGEGNRALAYQPGDVIPFQRHEVPKSEINLYSGHGGFIRTIAVIPGYFFDSIDAQGFEMWFKPNFPNAVGSTFVPTSQQVLLSWESGSAEEPGIPLTETQDLTPADLYKLVHEVFDDNVKNYLDAAAAGGPNGDPIVLPPSGGFTIPPPPPDLFSNLPNGQFPYGSGAAAVQAASGDAVTYATIIENYYLNGLSGALNDLIGDAANASSAGVTWGSKGRLKVWLEAAGSDSQSPQYTIKAMFEVEKKNESGNSSSHRYFREWSWDEVQLRAGTWHHFLFSFYGLEPESGPPPADHTQFFVDGHKVTPKTTGSPKWPSEQHAQARIVARTIKEVGLTNLGFNPEEYRIPILFPQGTMFVRVGKSIDGGQTYRGLVDNVIFHGNRPKEYKKTAIPGSGRRRFDSWRPSLGRKVDLNSDDKHVFFNKRTAALEWEKAITIVGYDWTAWINDESKGANLDLGLM